VISSTRVRKVWLVHHRVDFRRYHDGLLAEAFKINKDPFMGDLLIFVGRGKSRLKLLYADATGLWVSIKIFTVEAMKTKLRFLDDPTCSEITEAELALVLEGAAYSISQRVAPYQPPTSHVGSSF
jgi:hypothetical protein